MCGEVGGRVGGGRCKRKEGEKGQTRKENCKMWSKRCHSFYETNEAAVFSPLVRRGIKTVAIKSFPSCSNPPWLSCLEVKALEIKRRNSAMTLSSAVQVSVVVLAVFCSLCRSAAGEDLRAAPPELRLFGPQIKVAFVWVFIFFPIHLFVHPCAPPETCVCCRGSSATASAPCHVGLFILGWRNVSPN